MSKFELNPELDLVLERIVDVSPELVWQAWTRPEYVKQWFAPAPWSVSHCEIDLRPGGQFSTTLVSPEGQEFPNLGCYLEIETNRKLVFTDALQPDYRPSPESFFTAIVSMEPHGDGGCKYTAIALHKDPDGRKQHQEMGFLDGWGKCLDQLVVFVKTLD